MILMEARLRIVDQFGVSEESEEACDVEGDVVGQFFGFWVEVSSITVRYYVVKDFSRLSLG